MNEVATQKRHPITEFKDQLDKIHQVGELALPDTVPFKNFKNAAVVALTDNPDLLRCDRASVFKALRTLAAMGLVPDGKEAAVVAYAGKAQALPMVWGLVKIARNSGKISTFWADVVYDGETLEVWVEDGERKWNHVREDGSRIDAMSRGGEIRGAYAVAKLIDGTVEFQPMSRQEIEKRRRASASQKNDKPAGVWQNWYDEQAKKTVIRNLAKRLPMSADDIERLMREDETNEPRFKDVTPEEPAPRKNLAQRLAEQEILPPEDAPQDDDVPTLNGEVLDLSQAFPGSDDYDAGVKAYQAGEAWQTCPHSDDRAKATDWIGGYMAAKVSEGEE